MFNKKFAAALFFYCINAVFAGGALFAASTSAAGLTVVSQAVSSRREEKAARKKVLIICDVHEGAIGGTEEVLGQIKTRLKNRNIDVDIMDVSYLSLCGTEAKIADKVYSFQPDHILISLLGMMSFIATRYCANNNIPFTTFCSVHIPKLFKKVAYTPEFLTRPLVNNYFLPKASKILVPTDSFKNELTPLGFKNVITWPHGIDLDFFTLPTIEEKELARKTCNLQDQKGPFYLYVGHVSKVKNLPAFLNLDLPGTKIIVGDENIGCKISDLQKQYPAVIFAGPKRGKALLNYYHASDIFVFPSKLDTFGLVMLEALATGLPIVGFNITGPADVVPQGCGVSYLAEPDTKWEHLAFERRAKQAWCDLQHRKVTPEQCRAHAKRFSWDRAMDDLIYNLVQIDELPEQDEASNRGWFCCGRKQHA